MSNFEPIKIREATEGDLEAIAHVLVDTWRTTFRGLLADEFLDGLSYGEQEERHRKYMLFRQTWYFVAQDDLSGEVVGFANGGPNRHGGYPYAGELYALYMRQTHQGHGLGRKLFLALADQLLRSGLTSMMVWVLVNNPNRGFYERMGGREMFVRPLKLGPTLVDEIAFAWDDLEATLGSSGWVK